MEKIITKKVTAAYIWLDTCSGCVISFLDIDDKIIDIADLIDFKRCPVTDIKDFSPVDVGIIEGAVGTVEHEEITKELRANSQYLVAIGDCACFGGISSMRNLFDRQEVVRRAFVESESTVAQEIPSFEDLPPLLDKVMPVNEVVKVDCYVPGCPPGAEAILFTINELMEGRIPVLPSELYKSQKEPL